MSIVVGTLTIDLKANTASFSQSMDKMSQLSAKSANDIKRSLEKIAAAGAALVTGLAVGTAALVESSINTIGSLNRLAQASGTTVEKFSALAYAARISHVEVDDMAKGMEKLAKSAFGAQNGNAGLERIFGRMGISVADSNHHLKDSSDLFDEVAVKFAGMANGAGKTALAMALFGKAGAAMIPMLNALGKQVAEVNEQAKRFGLVIGGDTATKAHEFKIVIEQLKAAQEGFGIQLAGAVLPALLTLSDRLQALGRDYDIPKLAQAFGEKLSVAITKAGDAFEFAVKHAHELKVALEALAALQVGRIAIPVIADLANGGMAKAGEGVAKMLAGLVGLGRVIKPLEQFAGFLKTAVWMVGSLAAEEGIASAAGYALATAFAAVGGVVGVSIAAIAGLAVLLYKFRDATFSIGSTTYELRDVWNAAWIVMGNVFHWVGDEFHMVVDYMRTVWNSFTKMLSDNIIVKTFKTVFTEVLEFARKILGALVPRFVIDALDQAKAARESESKKAPPRSQPPQDDTRKPADTEGLGAPVKVKKDVYTEETLKLVGLVKAQQDYLAVLDGTPEQIAAVGSAEKANAVILALNTKLIDEKLPVLTEAQKRVVALLVATEDSTKVEHEYGAELVAQQHSAELATLQARAMAAANLEGTDAVRQATVANAILGLTYNRTAAELKNMGPELVKLQALLTGKQSSELVDSLDKEIFSLRQEVAVKQIAVKAAAQFVDAQRAAALAIRLYAINQELATSTDKEAIAALQTKRQLIIDLTKAEWAEEDAKGAISLRSPVKQYQEEISQLNREVVALKAAQGGELTYAQSLEVAAKAQEAYNKATDETVKLLLQFGGLTDGVTAFFLDMEKQAKTTAAVIYEALHSAFDKLSDQLANLFTGKKTDFRKMFQDIGKEMVSASIKAELQTGLGALGKKLGISLPGALGGADKPDGSYSKPWWVRIIKDADLMGPKRQTGPGAPGGGSPASSTGNVIDSLNSGFGRRDGQSAATAFFVVSSTDGSGSSGLSGILASLGGSGTGGAAGMLGGAGSAASDGSTEAVSSSISYMAAGGDMAPDKAYIVGDQGPEIKRGNRITSNSASRRMLEGQASNHYYSIDARGTDPVLTEQRTQAAILAAHSSAISRSAQLQAERIKRMPQR